VSQNILIQCPKDGIMIKDHPKCEGCGYLAGLHHELKETDLETYRGKRLCAWCIRQWRQKGNVPFEVFIKEEKPND
jgi:hypothetical protein